MMARLLLGNDPECGCRSYAIFTIVVAGFLPAGHALADYGNRNQVFLDFVTFALSLNNGQRTTTMVTSSPEMRAPSSARQRRT